jgi:hypothetical protein
VPGIYVLGGAPVTTTFVLTAPSNQGRIDLVCERVIAFVKRLGKRTEVVVEAIGNILAVAKLIAPHVK